jgi:hypothetical protein
VKLRHVFAVGLVAFVAVVAEAPSNAGVKSTVYVPAVLEDIPAPGELIIDDDAPAASCQGSSCSGPLRSRKHKPVRKLLGRLRGK